MSASSRERLKNNHFIGTFWHFSRLLRGGGQAARLTMLTHCSRQPDPNELACGCRERGSEQRQGDGNRDNPG